MKIRFILLLTLFFGSIVTCYSQTRKDRKKADKNTINWQYEIRCDKKGRQGTSLVLVTSYVRKIELAIEQSKKNAVHGVIFTGLSTGDCNENPLIKDPEVYEKEKSFFNDFFSEYGEYSKYCTATTGLIEDFIKINRKEFSTEMKISVNKDLLRKDFEKLGLIKSLTSGF